MKSFLAAVLVAASFVAVTASAEPSPQSNCSIRKNGQPTGEVIRWDNFFSRVHQFSQNRGCAIGKISYTANSGRMYVDGRKVGSEMSNNQIEVALRQYGQSSYSCPVFTCDEIGLTVPAPRPVPMPAPRPPQVDPYYPRPYPGIDPMACLNKIMNKGYGPASAKQVCDGISTDAELRCVDVLLNKGYGTSTIRSTCLGVSHFGINCMTSVMDRGYGPQSAQDACRAVNSQPEYDCLNFVMSKGYGTSTAKQTCEYVSYSQLQCIRSVMDRGYGPMSAKNTCQ